MTVAIAQMPSVKPVSYREGLLTLKASAAFKSSSSGISHLLIYQREVREVTAWEEARLKSSVKPSRVSS